jgi:hypothetical protein
MSGSPLPSFDPSDPLGIDDLLGPEDLAVRDTMRRRAKDRTQLWLKKPSALRPTASPLTTW